MNPRYWSSSKAEHEDKARALNEAQNNYGTWGQYASPGDPRCFGMPLRGVYDDRAPSVSHEDYVDLGLSVKWAGANMGAASCEETGTRYAWGDSGKTSTFDWESYPFSTDGTDFTRYNSTDGLQYLLRENDAVYRTHPRSLEASWRIPSLEEWQELQDGCTWTEAILNGVRGYVIQSKVNSNAIFLPLTGYLDGTQLKDGMKPRYWSSTKAEHVDKARALNEAQNNYGTWGQYAAPGDPRCFGMPLRGVYDDSFGKRNLSEGELIDMGLSVKWARCNEGGSSPEESGSFFAWGELESKGSYVWATYRYANEDGSTMLKYNSTDKLNLLEKEDDLVAMRHGGMWRMPTIDHWNELWENCTAELVWANGVRGYFLTSNINGNTLFIPLSGYLDDDQRKDCMKPRYWSSTKAEHLDKARALNEAQNYYGTWGQYAAPGDPRCFGMPVRGVYDNTDVSVSPGDYIDLGLSVKWASMNIGSSEPEEFGKFYAWGETQSKGSFSWDNYKFMDAATSGMSKYNNTDGLTVLERTDDVAYVTRGGGCRMPTVDEWTELKENCEWKEVVRYGRKGFKISSSNGNSIFLPITGFKEESLIKDGATAHYWSSTRGATVTHGRALNEAQNYHGTWGQFTDPGDNRFLGMPVRAVRE